MPEVAIKKSLNKQRMGYGLRAAKTDSNAKGRVEQQRYLARSGWAMAPRATKTDSNAEGRARSREWAWEGSAWHGLKGSQSP